MKAAPAERAVLFLLGSIIASPAFADFTSAFASPAEAAQANERTVGVVFERDELFFDLIEDIESSLNLAAGLRIVPIVGKNHVQNVYDLLYLDGVDLALVRSDSIEYVRRVAGLAGARRLVDNVARVGNERIVVVAHEAYTSLDQLADHPVAFGRPGSGEFVTGTLLFDSIGVEVEKIEAAGEDALGRVRSGELAAMVHLLDASGALAADGDAAASGVNVLALPRDERLSAIYRRTTLDADDLPGLIGAGESVPSYSVDVNLVAYAWNSSNDRTRRMGLFVKALVERLEELQGEAFQPEWNEVRLETATPNIDDSPMVERALAEREAALERWHERRTLAREAESGTRTVRVERLESGGTRIVEQREPGPGRGGSDEVERMLDELDALLAHPVGDATPAVADEESGEAPQERAPLVVVPNRIGADG